jgi:competence ComEA-like helix-hairpin-helix protein
MKIRKIVRNFFGFSRTETNGFLVLMPLMIFVIFSEPLYRNWRSQTPIELKDETHKLDSLVQLMAMTQTEASSSLAPVLFPFDPNKATQSELTSLGFSKTLASRIENYRNKGGEFRIKKDLLRLYGMDSSLYAQLYPYMLLPESLVKREKFVTEKKNVAKIEKIKTDLNQADTAALKEVYGIGEKLSLRIINYRNSLGGFIQTSQLKEVYGLDSMVVNRILKNFFIPDVVEPTKININTASEEVLAKHPYIKYKNAKAIVAFRYQHKAFNELDELLNIKVIDQNTFDKIKPYLTVSD